MKTKKINILFQVIISSFLIGCFWFQPESKAATFPDVPDDHYANPAVETLYSLKVIKGYDDGTFKPDKPVNRVEALKIILEGAKLAIPETEVSDNSGFSDVIGGQWYARYVKKAKELGIVKGNPDGSFAPERQVNLSELLKILFLTNNIDLTGYDTPIDFPYADINSSEWYFPYINYAIKFNIISPNEQSLIGPGKMLTRADVAETVYRLILIQKLGQLQQYLSQAESLLVQTLNNINIQNFQTAKTNTEEAVSLTSKAAFIAADKAIVLAANKVAEAMNKLVLSYISLAENQKDEAITSAEQSKNLGNEAKSIDQSVAPMIDKIHAKADSVINHAKQ